MILTGVFTGRGASGGIVGALNEHSWHSVMLEHSDKISELIGAIIFLFSRNVFEQVFRAYYMPENPCFLSTNKSVGHSDGMVFFNFLQQSLWLLFSK